MEIALQLRQAEKIQDTHIGLICNCVIFITILTLFMSCKNQSYPLSPFCVLESVHDMIVSVLRF